MPAKFPPAWSLNQCIKAAKAIYEIHGQEKFNIELLIEFLDTTKTSSNFNRRTSALKEFGLINKSDETIQLTDLAVQIVNPVAGEDKEAKFTAFKKIDVLADLLPRYPNGKLPLDSETLKNVLLKSLQIDRDTIPQWFDFVTDSFKAISDIGDLQTNEFMQGKKLQGKVDKSPSETEMRTSTVYLPSGKRFSFSVEANYTAEDMAFVQNLLNLFLQATQKTTNNGDNVK